MKRLIKILIIKSIDEISNAHKFLQLLLVYASKIVKRNDFQTVKKFGKKINLKRKLVSVNHILTFGQIDDGRFEKIYSALCRHEKNSEFSKLFLVIFNDWRQNMSRSKIIMNQMNIL